MRSPENDASPASSRVEFLPACSIFGLLPLLPMLVRAQPALVRPSFVCPGTGLRASMSFPCRHSCWYRPLCMYSACVSRTTLLRKPPIAIHALELFWLPKCAPCAAGRLQFNNPPYSRGIRQHLTNFSREWCLAVCLLACLIVLICATWGTSARAPAAPEHSNPCLQLQQRCLPLAPPWQHNTCANLRAAASAPAGSGARLVGQAQDIHWRLVPAG